VKVLFSDYGEIEMGKRKPIVISIAAVSGGGKTTIVNRLSKILKNSKPLFFDEYEFDGPDDICDWVKRGADYNEWNLTPLIRDLRILISDPLQSVDYILLDYPFAYKHSEMQEYIDFTIFIDTPLDIAMARRILRDFIESIDNVRNDLNIYLSRGRKAYLEMLNTIKPNSDLIIDGSLELDDIINRIYEKVIEINR
jgi:uridine kinase